MAAGGSAQHWTVARPRTGVVTLAVPHLREPYFAELTEAVVARAAERGLSVVIQLTNGDHEREVEIANGVGTPPSDGLLHIPLALTVADLARRASPGPLVLLGEHIKASPFAHVTVDNHAVALTATRWLIDRGCTRVAMVGPRDAVPSDAANRRYAGYLAALTERGLPFDVRLTSQLTEFSSDEGFRATLAVLDAGAAPDGIVAANDSVAFGVVAALASRGIDVPGEIQVIGIDGVAAGAHTVPSLTTVAPDVGFLAERALELLQRQIDTPPTADQPIEQITVDFAVVERDSTRPR